MLRIAADRISGATTGTVLNVTGPASFQASGSEIAGVPMVYELRDGSILAETIGDARAASLYLRCSR
ncbi:hypothetical protein MKK64_01855 [Methylobacterium sp. E-025]|uniref:hypothetical protein n=1 Tax=Methylobacterium sp. E-025 TaxID=2836561 RepID=UPI001FBA7D46|nr:hypothetical protein [Methylobacterium sp. E-025]MCJ2109968.1 hypothetical protein [Methylobacterium sp. E-025]